MLSISKTKKYQQIIKNAIGIQKLFPNVDSQGKKPIIIWQSDFILPSLHSFRSSQQNESNILITHHITHQLSKQNIQIMPTSLHTKWPQSCIGLILCQHQQNNQTFYVYGTGILIHNKIVLTTAQNMFCRRLHSQYINIKFITGVSGNKCSGIYDVKRVDYPKEYTLQEQYKNYNFAVLQLYDDLSKICGYIGLKTSIKQEVFTQAIIEYGYVRDNIYTKDNNYGFFNLSHTNDKQLKQTQGYSGSVLLIEDGNQCYIVGISNKLQNNLQCVLVSEKMRNIVNQWTKVNQIKLYFQNMTQWCQQIAHNTPADLNQIAFQYDRIDAQGWKILSQSNWKYLTSIKLHKHCVGSQGCKYLSQAKWKHLTKISLYQCELAQKGVCIYQVHKIGPQGCRYLSKANWPHLTTINLNNNSIGAEGCKYLAEANWIYLNQIELAYNNISTQGCKFLSQANWKHLTIISLARNKIQTQGCKYISKANWIQLLQLKLDGNQISSQGCKYLSQATFKYLMIISLMDNRIRSQGCKYLSQTKWIHLTKVDLQYNNICEQGCRFLSQSEWSQTTVIKLFNNKIDNIMDRIALKQLWPKTELQQQLNRNYLFGI